MKDINEIKFRLHKEYSAIDKIKYQMFKEISDFTQKAAIKESKKSERHVRNIQLLTRIIEDHNIETEIAELAK
jgi:hypothetical protein